jgi:hypothetical protein
MVGAVRAWAEAVHRTLPDETRTPELRYVDRLPDAATVVREVFDFAEALLKSQREFALELLEATEPLTRSVGLKVAEQPASVRSRRAHPARTARREAAPKHGPGVRSA